MYRNGERRFWSMSRLTTLQHVDSQVVRFDEWRRDASNATPQTLGEQIAGKIDKQYSQIDGDLDKRKAIHARLDDVNGRVQAALEDTTKTVTKTVRFHPDVVVRRSKKARSVPPRSSPEATAFALGASAASAREERKRRLRELAALEQHADIDDDSRLGKRQAEIGDLQRFERKAARERRLRDLERRLRDADSETPGSYDPRLFAPHPRKARDDYIDSYCRPLEWAC